MLGAGMAHADRPAQPNFLIILADDLGWQDIKCYDIGTPSVFETPYIDALSKEGILFKQAYSPAPTCAPSRCGIMSGKYPARLHKTQVEGGVCPKPYRTSTYRMMDPYYNARLELSEITIAEALKPDGYFSGQIGKWHLAIQHNSFPQPGDQGFDWDRPDRGVTVAMTDRSTGFATTNSTDIYKLDENGFAYDQTTENALAFLAEAVATNQPFFCYYATWLVHVPIQMRTERLLQKYCAKMGISYPLDGNDITTPGQHNPYYAAMVETLDYSVHRVVTYLKNTDDPRWPGHKLIENTYIFFTSDNGGCENNGAEVITDNFPLNLGKHWLQEGGVRVPFIAAGPGIATNVISEVMVNGLDLYPTILSLAGLPVPDRLDGCDLSALLLNNPQNANLVTNRIGAVRDTMYWHFPHGLALHSAIRKGGWKLFRNYDYVDNAAKDQYDLYQLYDDSGVWKDIGESVDLAGQDINRAAQLSAELNNWLAAENASFPSYNPKYPGTLAHKGDIPTVLNSGSSNGVAWITFSGNVSRADFLYTLNGGVGADEEWFLLPAELDPAGGRATAVIPDGTTHYLFDLIDTNNFLVSSVDVGQQIDGLKDSVFAPRYIREPDSRATILSAGTQFPTNSLIISNAVGTANGVPLADNTNAIIQAGGQTFTLSAPTLLSKLTLQAAAALTFGSGSNDLVLWIGSYSNGEPGLAAADTKVFASVDLSGKTFASLGYYTIDFTDSILPAGTYAFQLAWRSNATDHYIRWRRADGDGAYAGGGRLYMSSGSTIYLPFSGAAVDTNDVVFALHGSMLAGYDLWAYQCGLVKENSDPVADPDGDGVNNLIEYALGGVPNLGTSCGFFPRFGKSGDGSFQGLEYIYRRRRDAAAHGLTYTVEEASNLTAVVWGTNNITETGAGIIDSDFEEVTNRISNAGEPAGFVRLKVGVGE